MNSGGPWQISTDRGTSPRWAPDGRTLYYRRTATDSNDHQIWAVSIEGEDVPVHQFPELLITRGYLSGRSSYDVSSNDLQFLMIRKTDESAAEQTSIAVINNWFEELRRLAPADSQE